MQLNMALHISCYWYKITQLFPGKLWGKILKKTNKQTKSSTYFMLLTVFAFHCLDSRRKKRHLHWVRSYEGLHWGKPVSNNKTLLFLNGTPRTTHPHHHRNKHTEMHTGTYSSTTKGMKSISIFTLSSLLRVERASWQIPSKSWQ